MNAGNTNCQLSLIEVARGDQPLTRTVPVARHQRTIRTRDAQSDVPARKPRQASKERAKHAITDTSIKAYRGLPGERKRGLRDDVLAFIVKRGEYGATDEEITLALHAQMCAVNPRRGELVKAGKVARSDKRRPTRSTRMAIVWVAL